MVREVVVARLHAGLGGASGNSPWATVARMSISRNSPQSGLSGTDVRQSAFVLD